MATNKDSVRIINKIHTLLYELTEEDFKELEDMAKQQMEYYNPLKMGTTTQQHRLGKYNKKVIDDLRKLKQTFETGRSICNE